MNNKVKILILYFFEFLTSFLSKIKFQLQFRKCYKIDNLFIANLLMIYHEYSFSINANPKLPYSPDFKI